MGKLNALAKSLLATAFLAVSVVAAVATVAAPPARAETTGSPAYWLVGNNGAVYQLGTTSYGDMRNVRLARPVVGGAATDDGLGYWLVASDGGIFAFGDAPFKGSTGSIALTKPIVGMAADPVTGGYWLVASDGGIFAFGAPYFGSMGGRRLNKPVVGMAPTPDGRGYWLVASDGGIFSFGDAAFFGSTGAEHLNKPIVGMAPHAANGYWLVASDGGIFAFGRAPFYGSTGNERLAQPVVGMSATPDGNGYWMTASDGGVFTYGDAPFLGTSATNGNPPIVAIMSTANGYFLRPGATGYDVSQYQCPYYSSGASLPPSNPGVAVVQVSGGAIDQQQPAQCYPLEAQWAGPNMAAYIYMNPLPQAGVAKSMSGPAGNCGGSDLNCQAYNYGYNWAVTWVQYAHNDGTHPTLWWLDVETTASWSSSPTGQATNSREIAGAVAGLKASGVSPGIYSTHLQWGQITGNDVSFPGIVLWVPGATTLSDAQNMCTSPDPYHAPFAGGKTILIQYGYGSSPPAKYDQDYVCR